MTAAFAELGARTNFTLLDGASHPAEMVAQAAMLGHAGIGVCDLNSLAGVVRAHHAAKEMKQRFVVGARNRPRRWRGLSRMADEPRELRAADKIALPRPHARAKGSVRDQPS